MDLPSPGLQHPPARQDVPTGAIVSGLLLISFLLDLRSAPQERIRAWCYKPGQNLIVVQVVTPRGRSLIVRAERWGRGFWT